MGPRPWAGVFVGAALTLGSTAPAPAAEDLFSALGAERLVTPRAAPDLALPSLDGGTIRLKDLRGKVGLWGHPNTVMIDREGKVVGLLRGERDWRSEPARRLVGELLQEGTSERLERRRIVVGQETSTASAPVPVAMILAAPETFEGRQVTVRGTVVKAKRDVFPNGRPYHTLSVGVGERVLTVFSWSPPSAKAGDRVEAMGVFHVWRYNIHHMIDAAEIRRLEPAR